MSTQNGQGCVIVYLSTTLANELLLNFLKTPDNMVDNIDNITDAVNAWICSITSALWRQLSCMSSKARRRTIQFQLNSLIYWWFVCQLRSDRPLFVQRCLLQHCLTLACLSVYQETSNERSHLMMLILLIIVTPLLDFNLLLHLLSGFPEGFLLVTVLYHQNFLQLFWFSYWFVHLFLKTNKGVLISKAVFYIWVAQMKFSFLSNVFLLLSSVKNALKSLVLVWDVFFFHSRLEGGWSYMCTHCFSGSFPGSCNQRLDGEVLKTCVLGD